MDIKELENKIINADCLDILKELPDKCIDCVITSPPYNMNLRIHNGKYISMSDWNDNSFSKKYLSFKDDLTLDEYYTFNLSVLNECLRISNIVFFNIQMITGNKPALFKILGTLSDKIKEIIIWDKGNAQPAMAKNVLNSQFEFIIVFDDKKPYNRQFDVCNFERGKETNLWTIKRTSVDFHKATFPIKLVERILNNFTNKNDLVLDCFSGSGTTALACHNLKRRFICIEKDKDYYEASVKRLEDVQKQMTLFGGDCDD